MMSGNQRRAWAAAVAVAATVLLGLPSAGARGTVIDVIAVGLDNPRGIALGPNGAIFVAESGREGQECEHVPGWGRLCFGMTGSITKVTPAGALKTKVKLPSLAPKDGFAATSASDVVWEDGSFYIAMGAGPPNSVGIPLFGPDATWFNDLATAKPLERLAELGKWEAKHDPAADGADSNPYSLARVDGGTLVADAAGNSLLLVPDSGKPELVATFPSKDLPDPDGNVIPAQAVPTTVVVGPDGAFYVGELTGYPFTPGASRVWRIDPGARGVACDPTATGGACSVYADGLTAVIDIAFDPEGTLHVLEIAKNGLLALESSDPTPEDLSGSLLRMDGPNTFTEIASDGLVTPGGLAIAEDGSLFLTNYSIFPGFGEVVEIVP